MNTLDLRTLLRSGTSTKLRLGITYTLYAKIAEMRDCGQNNETFNREKIEYQKREESSKATKLMPMLKFLNLGYPT